METEHIKIPQYQAETIDREIIEFHTIYILYKVHRRNEYKVEIMQMQHSDILIRISHKFEL